MCRRRRAGRRADDRAGDDAGAGARPSSARRPRRATRATGRTGTTTTAAPTAAAATTWSSFRTTAWWPPCCAPSAAATRPRAPTTRWSATDDGTERPCRVGRRRRPAAARGASAAVRVGRRPRGRGRAAGAASRPIVAPRGRARREGTPRAAAREGRPGEPADRITHRPRDAAPATRGRRATAPAGVAPRRHAADRGTMPAPGAAEHRGDGHARADVHGPQEPADPAGPHATSRPPPSARARTTAGEIREQQCESARVRECGSDTPRFALSLDFRTLALSHFRTHRHALSPDPETRASPPSWWPTTGSASTSTR